MKNNTDRFNPSSEGANKAENLQSFLSDAFKRNKIDLHELAEFKRFKPEAHETIIELINSRPDGYAVTKAIEGKSFRELFLSDGLAVLKKYQPDKYRKLYFEEYGVYPKN